MIGDSQAKIGAAPILSIDVSVAFGRDKPVLQDLSLRINRGEILGLLGGSGCGKSTLALTILRLLNVKRATVSGSINFDGRELLPLTEKEMRRLRGREIGLVLQSPLSALNPMLRLGTQLREAWRAHEKRSDGRAEIAQALQQVSLPSDSTFLKRYPSQISLGQGQRVLIAMATLHSPRLLIADEPTSALDAITRVEILDLFRQINQVSSMSILLISHDLTAIRTVCDRIAIVHEGKIVGCDTWEKMLTATDSPYVHALMRLGTGEHRARTMAASQS